MLFSNTSSSRFVLALLVCGALSVLPSFATVDPKDEILAVTRIEHNGHVYNITEIVEEKRERIHPLNILRLKRGAKYRAYKVVDSSGVVRLSPDVFKAHKKELREVLDRRPWSERHPDMQRLADETNRWGTQVNTLVTWAVTLAK